MKVKRIPNVADFPPFTIPAEWRTARAAVATIVLFPALGTAARYYEPFAEACVAHGYNFLLSELPGTGASQPRPSRHGDYGYRELWSRFVPDVVRAARSHSPTDPVIVLGHSIGAHLAMLALAHGTIRISALVTIAAGNIHYRNWSGHGATRVLLLAWLVAAMGRTMGEVPGQYFGLGGPHPRRLMREWSRLIRSGSYDHIADVAPDRLPVPVLSIGYEGDFLAPCRSVAGMAHMLGGEMEWLTVDWPGNPHASWARHPENTLGLIDGWLAARKVVNPE